MKIESFLAAREELGFLLWGGLIRVDGKIIWSGAECVGRGPKFSVELAQYDGAVLILKKLQGLKAQHPESSISLITDNQALVERLKGQWAQYAVALDQAIDLVRSLDDLVLRYCERRANQPAHELITALCKAHRVPVREHYRRPWKENADDTQRQRER